MVRLAVLWVCWQHALYMRVEMEMGARGAVPVDAMSAVDQDMRTRGCKARKQRMDHGSTEAPSTRSFGILRTEGGWVDCAGCLEHPDSERQSWKSGYAPGIST